MPNIDSLIVSLLYLMTRHSHAPKAALQQAIADHMQVLATHPDCDSSILKDAGERLSRYWRQEARIHEQGLDEATQYSKRDKATSVH